jgi:hypothetical protein
LVKVKQWPLNGIYTGKISKDICAEYGTISNVLFFCYLMNGLASTVFCTDFTHVNPALLSTNLTILKNQIETNFVSILPKRIFKGTIFK